VVRKVTKYSDGGDVEYEKPTYWGAVKDRVKGLGPSSGREVLGTGAPGSAADKIAAHKASIDDKVTKIERGYKNGGVVPNGKYR